MKGVCISCGHSGVLDRCHIKSRGSGGSFDENNILLMCRVCHSTSHNVGWFRFSMDRPHVLDALKERGWGFENLQGVWKLRRLEEIA